MMLARLVLEEGVHGVERFGIARRHTHAAAARGLFVL